METRPISVGTTCALCVYVFSVSGGMYVRERERKRDVFV